MKRSLSIILMSLIIAGCATQPKEAFKIDCGPYPENFEEIIACYLGYHIEDPSSLKDFKVIKPPEKIKADTYYTSIPLQEGDEVWECFIVYDSKNKRGKHIGKDLHVVWFRDAKIVAFDYADIDLDFRVRQQEGNPCEGQGSGKGNS
ncbi:MAG: hypothetical protein WA081_15510 [Desulfosalsimonadaceae bacterium]